MRFYLTRASFFSKSRATFNMQVGDQAMCRMSVLSHRGVLRESIDAELFLDRDYFSRLGDGLCAYSDGAVRRPAHASVGPVRLELSSCPSTIASAAITAITVTSRHHNA